MNSSVEKLLFRFGLFYYYNFFQCTCIRYQLLVCLWLRRCKETSVFALAHAYIVPFFLYFFNVSFYEIPGIYYVCNFLPFLPPEVVDEENFAFKITFLFLYSSNNTTFSLYLSNLASVKTFFILNSHE